MARWEPDARGRLTRAALELFMERGYEQTTALEVAERAGVTERTFFRYFADKREVLFDGSIILQDAVLAAMESDSPSANPFETVTAAFVAAAPVLEGRRDFAQRRADVIASNPSLQERELLKLATLGGVIGEALRRGGVDDPIAAIAAEAGVMVFKVAFENWIRDDGQGEFAHAIANALGQLRQVATSSPR